MRNLAADLELCEAAPAGKYIARKFGDDLSVYIGPIKVNGGSMSYKAQLCEMVDPYVSDLPNKKIRAAAKMFAASREGWPEAIYRAIAAETLLRDIAPHAGRLPADLADRVNDATRETE